MPRYTFGGGETTTYAEYLDVDTWSTLVAEPGQTYDIAQAAGVTRPEENGEHKPVKLPMPPDENWKAAKAPATKDKE